jgi:peptidoglycan/LPS O-acetylase OafA/YrhL
MLAHPSRRVRFSSGRRSARPARSNQDVLASLRVFALYIGNAIDYGHYERTLAHTWSLAAEEHFYILFPVLFLLTKPQKRLAVLTTAMLVAFVVRYRLLSMG